MLMNCYRRTDVLWRCMPIPRWYHRICGRKLGKSSTRRAALFIILIGIKFGAVVFPSYGAFNLSYAMIYVSPYTLPNQVVKFLDKGWRDYLTDTIPNQLPGTGIIESYTNATTGEVSVEFNYALSMVRLQCSVLPSRRHLQAKWW